MIKIVGSKTQLSIKNILYKISPFIMREFFERKYKNEILRCAVEVKNDVENFFKEEATPLFKFIEIEMINRCNGDCSFCYFGKNDDPRPLAKMSEKNFRKIIDNLVKLNYDGIIYYHSNGESLMNENIFDFIKYGVSNLADARHILYTNGTLLNSEKFQKLIDTGLNYLQINNYSDKLELKPNIKKIYEEYKNKEIKIDCKIYLRLKNEILSTRGGTAPNRQKIKAPLNTSCYFPFNTLIIRADCGVSLCCNDALGKFTLGNVEEQSLEEIWFGEKFSEIRNSIRRNMRNDIEICRECDMIPAKNGNINYGVSPEFLEKTMR